MTEDTFREVLSRRDEKEFWREVAHKSRSFGFVDSAYSLTSLLTGILGSSPRLLHFTQEGLVTLTILFPFEFSRWKSGDGSLLLYFRGGDCYVANAWMMISDFLPTQNNPIYIKVAQQNDVTNTYLAALPKKYATMPLVYDETMAFAPWLRIVIDKSASFAAREGDLTDYIRFAARYSTDLPHFRGTEVTRDYQRDLLIFGYLSWWGASQSLPQITIDTAQTPISLNAIARVSPRVPEEEESAVVCTLAGRVFAYLDDTTWNLVMYHPYYLFTTVEEMTPDQLFASDAVVSLCQSDILSDYHAISPNSF